MYWTIRILSGVVRTLTGKGKLGGKKKKKGDGAEEAEGPEKTEKNK